MKENLIKLGRKLNLRDKFNEKKQIREKSIDKPQKKIQENDQFSERRLQAIGSVSEKIEVSESLLRNLYIVTALLIEEKNLNEEDLKRHIELTDLEIQQCLAFLMDQKLIHIRAIKKDKPSMYHLIDNFNREFQKIIKQITE